MSKICLIITKRPDDFLSIEKKIIDYCEEYGFGVFTSTTYVEPVMQLYEKDYMFFSLADSFEYDNCELLLLPDGSSYNLAINTIPFEERMRIVQGLISVIMKNSHQDIIHLFVGDSGTEYIDYQVHSVSVLEFPNEINRLCNCVIQEPIHFIVSH